MGFFQDLISAPAATISGTVDSVISNPVVGNIVNPGLASSAQAVQATTGLTPTQQYGIGALGGLGAMALGIGTSTAASVASTIPAAGAAGTSLIPAGLSTAVGQQAAQAAANAIKPGDTSVVVSSPAAAGVPSKGLDPAVLAMIAGGVILAFKVL